MDQPPSDLSRALVTVACGRSRHAGRVHAVREMRDGETEYFVYHRCNGYIVTRWHPRADLEVDEPDGSEHL